MHRLSALGAWLVMAALAGCEGDQIERDSRTVGIGWGAQLAVAEDMSAVIAWVDRHDRIQARMFDPDLGFGKPVVLAEQISFRRDLRDLPFDVAIAEDGRALVVWQELEETRSDLYATWGNVWYMAAEFDPEVGWLQPALVHDLGEQSLFWFGSTRLSMRSGIGQMLFTDSNEDIWLTRFASGRGWSEPVQPTAVKAAFGVYLDDWFELATGEGGRMAMGYTTVRGVLQLVVLDPETDQWQHVEPPAILSGEPVALAISPGGPLQLLLRSSDALFAQQQLDGGQWSEPVRLGSAAHPATPIAASQLVMAEDGTAQAAWLDEDRLLVSSRGPGADWSEAVAFATSVRAFRIASNRHGDTWVMWRSTDATWLKRLGASEPMRLGEATAQRLLGVDGEGHALVVHGEAAQCGIDGCLESLRLQAVP